MGLKRVVMFLAFTCFLLMVSVLFYCYTVCYMLQAYKVSPCSRYLGSHLKYFLSGHDLVSCHL